MRGELVDTLADLVDRLQTGRIAKLKRVIIETTGLADPAPVLQSIMGHPALVQAFRLDGVITLVDAVNGKATLDAHVEAVKQVAVADRLVITKTDLADAASALEALKARLGRINPAAPQLDVSDEATGVAALGAIFSHQAASAGRPLDGFVDGLNAILLVGAVLALVAAASSLVLIRRRDFVRTSPAQVGSQRDAAAASPAA